MRATIIIQQCFLRLTVPIAVRLQNANAKFHTVV